jgi:hypothetical protein
VVRVRFDVTVKESVGSTNDEIWDLAHAGAPAGVCVAAFEQHTGRGTFQRVWVSPQGGLYFSFLLRPPTPVDCWPQISPLLADAMAGVIRDVCGVGPDTVWVKPKNDVVCARGKLCGISLEARDGCLNIGCGSNVFHPASGITTDGRNTAVTLCDLCAPGTIADNLGLLQGGGTAPEAGPSIGGVSCIGSWHGEDAGVDETIKLPVRAPAEAVAETGLDDAQRAVLQVLLVRYLSAFSLLFDEHPDIV